MPRLSDLDKKSKLSALKKVSGKGFFGRFFGPSAEGTDADPDAKPPWMDCVNRDGTPCKKPDVKPPAKDDDEDKDE